MSTTKPELYSLVTALHARFNPTEIGATLGYSGQAIRNILAELGLTERRQPFVDRFLALDPALRQRIENFATQRRRQQQNSEAA